VIRATNVVEEAAKGDAEGVRCDWPPPPCISDQLNAGLQQRQLFDRPRQDQAQAARSQSLVRSESGGILIGDHNPEREHPRSPGAIRGIGSREHQDRPASPKSLRGQALARSPQGQLCQPVLDQARCLFIQREALASEAETCKPLQAHRPLRPVPAAGLLKRRVSCRCLFDLPMNGPARSPRLQRLDFEATVWRGRSELGLRIDPSEDPRNHGDNRRPQVAATLRQRQPRTRPRNAASGVLAPPSPG